ncbi:MAG: glycosyltransferase [Deltaproteobacteria bacterium]|nr:glycosyltransferase [Deltaproteobacteria bacterium]
MQAKPESKDILLSVVLPAFNEETEIGALLQDIKYRLQSQNYSAEIIVVDDASTDSTYKILSQFNESYPIYILRNSSNSGKGYSVKKGIMASSGRFILVMDADGAYSLSSLNDFLVPLLGGEYDIAVGNRRLHSSRFVMSPRHLPYIYVRHLIGLTFNMVAKMIVLGRYTDTQCGYKCFCREAATKIFRLQRTKGFCFDVEVLFIAKKLGYRCLEVPVTFHYDGEQSSVRLFAHSLHYLFDLIRIRLSDMLGRYPAGKDK